MNKIFYILLLLLPSISMGQTCNNANNYCNIFTRISINNSIVIPYTANSNVDKPTGVTRPGALKVDSPYTRAKLSTNGNTYNVGLLDNRDTDHVTGFLLTKSDTINAVVDSSVFATHTYVSPLFKTGDAADKYNMNGTNPFMFFTPYSSFYQIVFPIGRDSLCRIFIQDSTNSEQIPDHNYIWIQYNYNKGARGKWTTPVIFLNDSLGHPYDDVSGGQCGNVYSLFIRQRDNSAGIYHMYHMYSTDKCVTFSPKTYFSTSAFVDTQAIAYGASIRADSGKYYQAFYGFNAIKYGQLAVSTDGMSWSAGPVVFDTTVYALSEFSVCRVGLDSDIVLIRGGSAGTPYYQKVSTDNGNTWSAGIQLTNLGQGTIFNDVAPVQYMDTIRHRVLSFATQRFVNGNLYGRQEDKITVHINTPSQVFSAPLAYSYKKTMFRPSPTTKNFEGYMNIIPMDSINFYCTVTDNLPLGINASGGYTQPTNGYSTYDYYFTLTYDTTIAGYQTINDGGTAVYSSADNSTNFLNQPGTQVYDSASKHNLQRMQGVYYTDWSGNATTAVGDIPVWDTIGGTVLHVGTNGKVPMSNGTRPVYHTVDTTVTVVNANGISGTVATPNTNPAITLIPDTVNKFATRTQLIDTAAALRTTIATKGTGTVTTVSVVTANGISGTVATPSTTPAITLIPDTVNKFATRTQLIDTAAALRTAIAGAGTVTTVSGVAANGFTWSIANPGTTPAITLIADTINKYATRTQLIDTAAALRTAIATKGTGTVTSVTPGYGFTSSTPITTSGTLTIDTSKIATVFAVGDTASVLRALIPGGTAVTANVIYAGPPSGAAALPAFRNMVTADLPFFGTPQQNNLLQWNGSAWGPIIEGGSAPSAGVATMTGGAVLVPTTAINGQSIVLLTLQNCVSCGSVYVTAKVPGTSFIINSTNVADGSSVGWLIIDHN